MSKRSVALQRVERQPRMTWLDRIVFAISPQWGIRRMQARAAAHAMSRHYEAAQGGRRTSGWQRFSSDANAANGSSLTALRELSRDLIRNNGWAQNGLETIVANTVGWGISAKPNAQTARALDVWTRWAGSTACDFDGQLNFAGLQALAMRTVVESGEALILKQPAATVDGLPVPIRIQVLEPDYIDTTRSAAVDADGTSTIDGVEFDRQGRRVAYWLHASHPGARTVNKRSGSVRTLAANVLHVYRVNRPGQVRGVAWLASAIAKIKDLDDLDDAELMQQKIAACFGAFVTDMEGTGQALGAPGKDKADDIDLDHLQPGHIAYLQPGKTVTFAQPPTPQSMELSERTLRRIAASLQVTYEDLTGDYSKVNFSSARMARLAHWARVHAWRWHMLVPQFCDRVWGWVMELAQALEGWPEVPGVEWSAPPMPILEPDKEGLALQRLVRNGVRTWPQMIREMGEDPETQLAEIEKLNAELDKRGIVLDSDPRKTTAAGQLQGAAAASPKPGAPKPGEKPAIGDSAKPADDPEDKKPADEAPEEEAPPPPPPPPPPKEADDKEAAPKKADERKDEGPKVFAYHQPFMKVKEIREGIGLGTVEDEDLFANEFVAKHGGAPSKPSE